MPTEDRDYDPSYIYDAIGILQDCLEFFEADDTCQVLQREIRTLLRCWGQEPTTKAALAVDRDRP